VADRRYDEGCATAHALDVVGERWALLVVRELLFGPKRFTDLDRRLAGASTSVLTQRLKQLIDSGVVVRRKLPPPAGSWVYDLSPWGRDLQPIIEALGVWGIRSPAFDPTPPVTPASMALALRGFADPRKVAHLAGPIELELDDEVFRIEPEDGRLAVTAAREPAPPTRITAQPGDLTPFLHGAPATPQTLADHGIHVDGDVATVIALLQAVGADGVAAGPRPAGP
jgi:DNA-binding HxlR family transcriptional regulator